MTTAEQLDRIAETLDKILLVLTTRTVPVKPKKPSRSRQARELAASLETTSEQFQAERVVALWAEVCPHCPQPVAMDAQRRRMCRELWAKVDGEEGVRNFFSVVAGNDWWSGRARPGKYTHTTAPARRPVGLFEAIDSMAKIIEDSS